MCIRDSCLPVLFCGKDGGRVAVAHAGWRGLVAGILERTVEALDCSPTDLIAWLGPAIGPNAFQVGDEVRNAFIQHNRDAVLAFLPDNTGCWMADLYQLACNKLRMIGVTQVEGGFYCTYHGQANFYSYRRSAMTGRMAALAWLDSS